MKKKMKWLQREDNKERVALDDGAVAAPAKTNTNCGDIA